MVPNDTMSLRTCLYVKLSEQEAELDLQVTFNAHPGEKASYDSPGEEPSIEILSVHMLEDGSMTKVVDVRTPNWLMGLAEASSRLREELIEHAFDVWASDEDAKDEAKAQRVMA